MKFCNVLLWITFQVFSISNTIIAQNCDVKLYTTDDGLPQNNLTQLMFDTNGKLWIGTHGGLCIYDGHNFQKIEHEDLSSRIFYIHKDLANTVYICDEKKNIFAVNNFKLDPIHQNYASFESWLINEDDYKNYDKDYVSTHITSFLVLYLGYKNFKKHQRNKTKTHIKFNESLFSFKTFFLLDSVLIGVDKQNKWIKYLSENNQLNITSDLPLDFKKKGFVFNTDSGTYWLYNNIIFKIELNLNHVKPIPVLKNVFLDPIESRIMCGQFNSKTGVFYFGSAKNGLYEVKPHHFNNIKPKSKNLSDALKLNGQGYYSQSEIDSSTIFINNFVILKDSYELLVPNIKTPCIRCLNYVDQKAWLWYSDAQNIIIQKGIEKKEISLFPISHSIISIAEINNEEYLLLNSHYIIVMDWDKIIRRIYLDELQFKSAEYGKYIYYDKTKKKLYLLSSKKIYEVNMESEKLHPISTLTEADYQIMQALKANVFFIGTYGNGYFLKVGERYFRMPIDQKGHLKFAHAALVDDHGHVWISTNNGLFRTHLQDMMDYTQGKAQDIFYYYYDKSSGFLTNEFNGGCQSPAIKLRDGRFSFSSMDGLVQFNPLKVPALFPNNPLQIVHLSLNGQKQDSIPPRLEITQDIKDIKLEISTAFYGHPDNLVIQYKIPGYVESWTDLTDKRYIILQNANHGSFNIEIRKRSGFGAQDFDYLYYPITVLPYFYQTWWFMVCIGLGFILIIVIAARWYSRNLATQKVKLEKMVQDRNQSLIDINISLEDKIKQNEMFHSVMVHDIKAPLFFMGTISDEILKGLDHLSKDDIRNNISSVKQAASHLSNFIINFLTWVKSKNDNLSLQRDIVNLAELMHELKTFYSHTDKIMKGRLSIILKCDDNITVQANRQLLMIFLGNLLSNSIKFSTQGTITLYAYITDEGSTVIGCKDQGKGMNSETIALLTSSQYKGNAIREDSFRMGYVFINDIIKMMNATLSIYSIPGEGTDVSIEISL